MTSFRISILFAAVLSLQAMASARVRVEPIFSDHMVVQAGQPVPVWGTADAGEAITVKLLDKTATTTAAADGTWKITFDALPKQAEPTTLVIAGKSNTITAHDVLIGEVWLCSGQSNMALTMNKAADFDAERAAATHPRIRMFTTKWIVCSPDTIATFSAVAYFFGRELQTKLDSPVGLINRSAGGSPIELWTSLAAQQSVPEIAALLAGDAQAASEAEAKQAQSDRQQAIDVEGKDAAGAKKRQPGYLFEDRIVPLVPYAIRGVIWYQGEANSYTAHANLYGLQLATMIKEWRGRWGYDFPFISVQLPELGRAQSAPVEDSGRVWVREGVLDSLKLPNTGIAVTLGTGEANNNHPKNKQDVGRRLAAWALAKVYEQPGVVASGPVFTTADVKGSTIVLHFDQAQGGLVARGGGELKGFAIRGADDEWVWANARIEGESVIVSSPDVPAPVAVRYAWSTNPTDCNLTNTAGLPASPFRTDR